MHIRPSIFPFLFQVKRELSSLHISTDRDFSSSFTLKYHARAASHKPYTVFFSFHNLPLSYSFGGFRNICLCILLPCRYADFMSMVWQFHFIAEAIVIRILIASLEHVGESFCKFVVFSSKPLATSLAFVTTFPSFIFSVTTHLIEMYFWPLFSTISKTSFFFVYCRPTCVWVLEG